jgi:hypothetical protein
MCIAVAARRASTALRGAVNLASRLEHEAPPRGVLVSYETFAHGKDAVEAEERMPIRVKGIAYPVATYRIIGMKAQDDAQRVIRAELPHLKLEFRPDLMSPDERNQAALALRDALEGLDALAADRSRQRER